jgi:hypothetical protein
VQLRSWTEANGCSGRERLREGYHDRAFWKGWLEHLGCEDPGTPPPGRTSRVGIWDPWNVAVTGGQFAFHSPKKQFIRIVPCHGKSHILPAARIRLGLRSSKPILRLVISIDADFTASGVSTGTSGLQYVHVEQFARTFDPSSNINADGEIELDGGATKISLVRWEVPDPPSPGLPDQQTLERLTSAAVVSAYPARAAAVQAWLDARPNPPAANPKEHAWSYMAGWYADYGCEAFYSNLWSDPQVAAELRARLQASGAWQIAERLAN